MIRLFAGAALAAFIVVPATAQTIAVTNAHILGAASGDIASGTIVIQGGKITAVGTGVAVPSGVQFTDILAAGIPACCSLPLTRQYRPLAPASSDGLLPRNDFALPKQ